MGEDANVFDEATKQLYLDLFTEIAILEHLVRQRFEPLHLVDLVAADFGVLNYFVRVNKHSEKLKTLAWCFQVDIADMRKTVQSLAARKWLEIDWVEGDECIFISSAGRQKHGEAIADMAPDVLEIMAEFDTADLQVTARTLKEIRRTFDNLPDR